MKSCVKIVVFILIICNLTVLSTFAQDDNNQDPNEIKVKELVSFLQFTLNTIGSSATSPKEKDIIITQSYDKFFRDENVQVEDDLIDERETVTNKNVQAYLKDIDFFFKNVSFILEIEEIEQLMSDNDQIVYLVRLNRNLSGVTIDDDTINRNLERFIEINYNEEKDDLKIVSFYTTKLTESEDLFNWWASLSFEWRYLLSKSSGEMDSITIDYLKRISELDSLDLSDNPYITDIEPVRRLANLRYIDLSNTNVKDLKPLRSHTKISFLGIENTDIDDLSYLRYSKNLQVLEMAGSKIRNLETLEYFPSLIWLDISHTPVNDLHYLSGLKYLKNLNCSYSKIKNLEGLNKLNNLETLNISFTQIDDLALLSGLQSLKSLNFQFTTIDDLTPISNLKSIEVIRCENTNVTDLKPLNGLENLERVYCDNTGISLDVADEYMKNHPGVLIIFESQELRKWWLTLNEAWKNVIKTAIGTRSDPEREELALIPNIDSLNLSGLKTINNLEPVINLRNLRYLNCNDTDIRTLSPVKKNSNLEILIISNTAIGNLISIKDLRKLEVLDISNSSVTDISPINDLRNLKYLDLDGALVAEKDIHWFIRRNPACEVIYKSNELIDWWNALDDVWKEIFQEHLSSNDFDQKTYLHWIIRLDSIQFEQKETSDLSPLNALFLLQYLYIEGSVISDLTPLQYNPAIKYLTIRRSPVSDVSVLLELPELEYLDLGQTAIEDLSIITQLNNLSVLSLAGTKIRNLKVLGNMGNLKSLDISNTKIRSLKPISELYSLERLICYNTNLNPRKIEKFKSMLPECEVVFY